MRDLEKAFENFINDVGEAFANDKKFQKSTTRKAINIARKWKSTRNMLNELSNYWDIEAYDEPEGLLTAMIEGIVDSMTATDLRGVGAATMYVDRYFEGYVDDEIIEAWETAWYDSETSMRVDDEWEDLY